MYICLIHLTISQTIFLDIPYIHSKQYITITMQPQENPCRVLLGLHGNSTKGLFLKNLYCLECITLFKLNITYNVLNNIRFLLLFLHSYT